MPRFINQFLTSDLLASLDSDIESVAYEDGILNVTITEDATHIWLTEQDILVLLEFYRRNKLESES